MLSTTGRFFVWVTAGALSALHLLSVSSGGATALPTTQTAAIDEYRQVSLELPRGDRDAGRQAFLDLRCTVCHAVSGETDFPEPFGANAGPRLDRRLASRPDSYLATAIVAPTHSISIEVSDELKTRMRGVLSPMADYRSVMTVGQLGDLLAYLESLGG